ncbi:MAG: hypothetical protein KF753_16400 [Caldilineaceae bacterium]|nr:hypothetical protein [Caldilineaceae bacterium]
MTPNQIGSDMNYYETFIRVAPDCPVNAGSVPAPRGANKTVPVLEYELLSGNPYGYTQEELLFTVYAERLGLPADKLTAHRGELWAAFFSKSRACLRASSLPKRYGWGLHFDREGKIALYPVESAEYQRLADDESLTQLLAMRSKRA